MNTIIITTNDLNILREIINDELLKKYISNEHNIQFNTFGFEELIPIILSIPAGVAASLIADKIASYKSSNKTTKLYINNVEIKEITINNILDKLNKDKK